MSKKQCKRRIWRLVDPISHAIEGSKPPHGDKLDQLRTHELTAIDDFVYGRATINTWAKLTGLCNLAERMATQGVGIEVLEVAEETEKHLIEAAKRYETTGRMGMTARGLQCLRDLYEYHDLQRTSVTLSEYEKHIRETVNRVKSKAPEVKDMAEC